MRVWKYHMAGSSRSLNMWQMRSSSPTCFWPCDDRRPSSGIYRTGNLISSWPTKGKKGTPTTTLPKQNTTKCPHTKDVGSVPARVARSTHATIQAAGGWIDTRNHTSSGITAPWAQATGCDGGNTTKTLAPGRSNVLYD